MSFVKKSLITLAALSVFSTAHAAPRALQIPGEPVKLSLNNPAVITSEILPTLAKKVAQQFNMDIFDFVIPAPPDYREPLGGLLECDATFKADLRDIFGSVGIDRNSFQWSFARGRQGVDSTLRFRLPGRLETKTRLEVLVDCFPNQHLIYEVAIDDLVGEFRSKVRINNGKLELADRGSFHLAPGRISIHRSGESLFIGTILDVIDAVLSGLSPLGTASGTDDLIEILLTDAINGGDVQGALRDALYEAINKSLADPLRFEEATFFEDNQLGIAAGLSAVTHVPNKGISTTWNVDVSGAGPQACAAGLRAPARIRQHRDHQVGGDLAVEVPFNLINTAVYEVVRQGPLCVHNKVVDVMCSNDEINRAIRKCVNDWDADPRSCSEVLSRHIGGAGEHHESIYLNLGFRGTPTFARLRGSPRGLKVTLPLEAQVMFAGLPVGTVKAKASVSGELIAMPDHTVAVLLKGDAVAISQLQNFQAIEAALCGADINMLKNVLEGEIASGVLALPPIQVTTAMTLLDNDFTVSLDLAHTAANAWSIYLPFNIQCTGEGCVDGVERINDCGRGGSYDAVKKSCYLEQVPSCAAGQLIVDRGGWINGKQVALLDMCQGNNPGNQGNSWQGTCSGPAGTEYSTRRGQDMCRIPYRPVVTYREIE
jgi:hypothetical protein